MYNTRSLSGRSHTTGLTTVVALHVGLVGLLVTMKPPGTVFEKQRPPIETILLPNVAVPTEPLELPTTPDDSSAVELVPEDTVRLPEFVVETFAPAAPTIPLTSSPGTATPPRAVPDVRKSAAMPGSLEKPPYPTISERLNEEGLSTVEACISPKGTVSSVRLVESSGFNRLDDATIKWVRDIRGFKPATLNGKPVADCFSIPVEWKIEKR